MSNNQNVGEIFAAEMAQPEPKKLVGSEATKQAGSFVYTSQGTATEQGFSHVSKYWYPKTMSYEQGLEQLETGKALTEDLMATVKEMVPTVENGSCVLRYKDGRTFRPTEHCVSQMGNWADTGTWFVMSLLRNPEDNKGNQLYSRDAGDAATLAMALTNGFRRLDPNKKFLFRTRKDGTLRAMLTERYAIVDNRWFVERLRQFIPGGRLSHWKGDSDTIYGNVLIPDTIREEKDSDYGGMLSVGNSEIGERRVSSLPSIFRAICMNGCIWGQTKGEGIRQVHRGKINLESLALEIKENLNKQIPLLPQGIDKFLNTRSYAWDGASAKVVIAQLSKDYTFSKKQATATLLAYNEERAVTPDLATTLFGVTNAVTRAAQKFSPAEWVKFDEVGGRLANMKKDEFNHMITKAKHLKEKEVEDVYASV